MIDKLYLRICGIDVTVEFSDPADWASGGMGRSSQLSNRITLRKGMSMDVEGAVLLHEVLHLIADMNELDILRKDETAISVIANGLNAFLRDNELDYWETVKEDNK